MRISVSKCDQNVLVRIYTCGFAVVLMACTFCGGVGANTLDSIYYQDRFRLYRVHEPTGYKGTDIHAVVMVLHGGTGSAESAINFSQMDRVADTAGFLAVFPQGYAEARGGYAWADGRQGVADQMGIDDVGFIAALIDTLDERRAIDVNRIYVSGVSNGGFMTQRLACELGDRIAAAAPVCATMDVDYFAGCLPVRPVPVMMVMGTEDPFVPYEGGRMSSSGRDIVSVDTMISFWVQNNNCLAGPDSLQYPNTVTDDNSTVMRYTQGACDCDAKVVLYKVIGGGHTWPGVENPSYERIAGETNEDIHASEEIWNFCRQHTRTCNTTAAYPVAGAHRRYTGNGMRPGTRMPLSASRTYLYSLSGAVLPQGAVPTERSHSGHIAAGLYVRSRPGDKSVRSVYPILPNGR
ncbi:MAG: prolyl oligopeptidase family serine peptidase [Chitinivibrionales bacterium]|nr:prolyl oligopeptidase family serine peptidase [Chitinivibrionales bacterium]